MDIVSRLRLALRISGANTIARRYFVTNGFDGALTLLGLLMGFRVGGEVALEIALAAGFGTSVALGVSGLSSAYISETAERRQEFRRLQEAMAKPLDGTAHEHATRVAPVLVALVNGLSPFLIAQTILMPLWLGVAGFGPMASAVDFGIAIALVLVFLLGVYLGRISGTHWLWSGIRAALLAIATAGLILVLDI